MPSREQMISYIKATVGEDKTIYFMGDGGNPLAGSSLQAITNEGVLNFGYLGDWRVESAGPLSAKEINAIKEKDIEYDSIFERFGEIEDDDGYYFEESEVLLVRKGCKPDVEYFYVDRGSEYHDYDEDELILYDNYYEAFQDLGSDSEEGVLIASLEDLSSRELLELYSFIFKHEKGEKITKAEEDDINSAFEVYQKAEDAHAAEEKKRLIRGMYRVRSVLLSPSKKTLSISFVASVAHLWDIDSENKLWGTDKLGRFKDYFYSPNFKIISAVSYVDNEMIFFDTASLEELTILNKVKKFHSPVAFSPDGITFASTGRGKDVYLWDMNEGEKQMILRTFKGFASSLTFSPDGKLIASVLGKFFTPNNNNSSNMLQLWDITSGKDSIMIYAQGDTISKLKFSPDGKLIATISDQGKIVQAWDTESGQEQDILSIAEGAIEIVDFDLSGKIIAASSVNNNIKVWCSNLVKDGMLLEGHEKRILSMAFNPVKSILASGSWDNTIRIWDTAEGIELRILRGHEDVVSSLCFSTDGSMLVSGSWDNTVRLWNVDNGEAYKKINLLP